MNPVLIPTSYGPSFWCPENDYVTKTITRGLKNSGYSNFLKYMKPNARVACDVGANIGEITWSLSTFCETVFAFEPVQDTFSLLSKNVVQNNIDNAIIMNVGIGARRETAKISLSTNTCGANARTENPTANCQDMTIIPLDDLCIANLDIIKIDVEGYELDVLIGGENTIVLDRPIIQLEVYEPALKRAKRDIQDIYDWLIARDFVPYYVQHRKIFRDGVSYTKIPRCIERFFVHSSIVVGNEVPKDVRIVN